jgi:hypothetical protein
MKHSLPFTEIELLGVPVRVRLVKTIDEVNDKYGIYDLDRSEIKLSDVSIEQTQLTLCHEIVHFWQRLIGRKLAEDEANYFALCIYDLVRHSPGVIKFIGRRKW